LESIKTVAVLGAGTMGNGIAHVFARAGYNVILRDVQESFLQRGMEAIGKNLDREVKKGKLMEAEKPEVLQPWQLKIDTPDWQLKTASVEALKDLVARRRLIKTGKYIRPRGTFGSSIF